MVSLERARELGEAMGMPARRTQSEAFRVVANNPGVARVAFSQLMQLLENTNSTPAAQLMMRIGWVTGSAYEWTQHWRVATTAGIPPEDILAVRDWQNSERLTQADKAILAATDECLAGKSISDAAWADVAKHVADPGQQVEFVIAMGNWMMFSLLFRNLRIPLAEESGSGRLMVWRPRPRRDKQQRKPALNAHALACRWPFADGLRSDDQRLTAIAAMLCSHSCRASPVR
jgi:alkylhydroperoxidase family enzyme